MRILGLLTACVVVRESLSYQSTPQPVFNPRRVESYRNAEPKRKDLDGFKWWNTTYDGVQFTGFLFAGRAEFPWVVHIRDGYDQLGGNEFYSIGNLVSNQHVLTVCRAVSHYHCTGPRDKTCQDEPGCPCPIDLNNIYNNPSYIEKIDVETLYVYFFPLNPNHQSMLRNPHGEYVFAWAGAVQGSVGVLETILHPKCVWDRVLWFDVAVVILKHALPSMNMWVGVIQIPIKDKYLMDDDRLKYIEHRRMLCYVASVGFRPLYGVELLDKVLINNYKVKYRVYPVDWQRCRHDLRAICRGFGCLTYVDSEEDRSVVYRIECWQSRNKVGTICDRDRGAPVVCEGKVEGFVIRGALRDYCNPGIQLPFMMQRVAEDYPEFLEALKRDRTAPLPINPLPTPYSGSSYYYPSMGPITLFMFLSVEVS